MKMQLPRNIKADETRKNLLTAAGSLIREKPFGSISIDEICQQANVTKGAFYYHFRSKQAILAVLYFEQQDLFFRAQGLVEPGEFQTKEELSGWLERYVDLYLRFLTRWDAEIVGEVHRSLLKKQIGSKMEYNWVQRYRWVCDNAYRKGLLRQDLTPEQLHSAIMGWSSGIILLWSLNDKGFSYEMPQFLVREFVALFLA